MQKILFPTDFSESADHAFIYALEIAKALDAEIITLHVYRLPDIKGVILPNTLNEIYESINLEEFETYRDNIPHLHKIAEDRGLGNVQVRHILKKVDHTVDSIIEVANKEAVDLIVMGTKGAGGLKEVFIGSVAGEILENANCPTLAIPQEAVFKGKIDQIAITTDFKEEEKAAIRKVIDFAKPFNAQVHCINVDTAHSEFYLKRMDKLRKEFEGAPNINFMVLDGYYMEEEISNYVETHYIDILAMVTHKRNFIQELFSYSHAKKLSYHSTTPILSIQAHTLSNVQ